MDLDGTILYEGKPVKGVMESIKLLKENNHDVAIATGRSPLLLYDIDKILNVDYLILANGGYVKANNKVIYERYIPNEMVKIMMQYSDSKRFDLVIEYDDVYLAYRKDTDIPDRFCNVFKIDLPALDRTFYPNRNVFSMLMFDKKKMEDMRRVLPELQFNLSSELGFDVNTNGGLKADGINALAKHLGYNVKDVYAIGDGYNDISMIQLVGHGIAMENAGNELKQVAEYVTTDVNDYGFQNALKYYHLI